MSDRPLIDDSLAILNLVGFVTYKNNSWGKLRKLILIILLGTAYLDALCCTIVDWNKPDFMENLFVVFGLSQILLKILGFPSQTLLTTLSKMKIFYALNEYGSKQEKRNKSIFAKVQIIFRSFTIFFFLILFLFSIKPFFTAEKTLPYSSYVFGVREPSLFNVGYGFQIIVLIFIAPVQVGFDLLYISLITNVVCEFKLLKAGFAQIPINENVEYDENTSEALRNLIVHHNVILECSKSLREVYYFPFLYIFLFSMLGIGFCLLCIIVNGIFRNVAISMVFASCALFYTLQLLLYCAPGTILILESTEVSDVVFNTDWWIRTQPELRRTYVRILQRANKPVILSAGGMANVTLGTFTAIVKSALSFFTCVQAMYRNNL